MIEIWWWNWLNLLIIRIFIPWNFGWLPGNGHIILEQIQQKWKKKNQGAKLKHNAIFWNTHTQFITTPSTSLHQVAKETYIVLTQYLLCVFLLFHLKAKWSKWQLKLKLKSRQERNIRDDLFILLVVSDAVSCNFFWITHLAWRRILVRRQKSQNWPYGICCNKELHEPL